LTGTTELIHRLPPEEIRAGRIKMYGLEGLGEKRLDPRCFAEGGMILDALCNAVEVAGKRLSPVACGLSGRDRRFNQDPHVLRRIARRYC
jgi:hypothetical protein